MNAMADDSAEIFDDLYLGLRAGGALRKQRPGESLTPHEQEALGRWQRLSTGRKAIAIGGFALGTFGLGFTLGGLVFGRWRKGSDRLASFFFSPPQEHRRHLLLGRIDVADDDVDQRREHCRDRDREQHVEA